MIGLPVMRQRVVFGLLMAVAVATACSGGPGVSWQPDSNSRTVYSGSAAYFKKHGRRIKSNVMYTPPPTITGAGGSYCYMNNAPGGPGGSPTYICYMNENDSVTFSNFWQVPLYNYLPNEICGAATWAVNIQGTYGSSSLTWSTPTPDVTGIGNWSCKRVDIVSTTFQRGVDNGHWIVDTHVDGTFTVCGNNGQGPCSFNGFTERAFAPKFYPGPPPSPLPTPVPTPYDGGWPSPGPSVGLVIYDKRLKQIVSTGASPFPNSVIGLQNYLIAEDTNGVQLPSSTVKWSQFGNPSILSQSFSDQAASEVTPGAFPSTGNPALFYWYAGGSPTLVVVSAPVQGNALTAYAFYNAETPNLESMGAYFNTPDVYINNTANWYFRLGLKSPMPYSSADIGITSNYTAVSPTDFGGFYAENQIANAAPSTSPTNIAWYLPEPSPGVSWADGCWIYSVNKSGGRDAASYGSPAATATVGPTFDSPGYNLTFSTTPPILQALTVNAQFQDHLIFRPAVYGGSTSSLWPSIWVTLAQLLWSWGGKVSNNGSNVWTITPNTKFVSPGPGNQTGSASTWLPYWPNNYARAGSATCPPSDPTPPRYGRTLAPNRHAMKPQLQKIHFQTAPFGNGEKRATLPPP